MHSDLEVLSKLGLILNTYRPEKQILLFATERLLKLNTTNNPTKGKIFYTLHFIKFMEISLWENFEMRKYGKNNVMYKHSPTNRTKLRGLYTTAKADAEAECNILQKALDQIAEIKSLLEERRISAKIAGLYNDSEPPRKTMRRGVLMTLLQQSAMTLPLWIGKPGDKPPPLCGAIPASGDYVAKPGDKVAARVKAVDGDEQWILAEVVSYSHATNKYEVDDSDEEGKERHTLSWRRIIPLPQWKANPETDPEALFQKEQLVLALYPQTTCFYRALIHSPPQRPQDDYSVLFEDTSYADGYSPPLNVAQRYVVACKEPKKK
nr:SAGA-associated factor 29-like [Oryctolagus cuniculus]